MTAENLNHDGKQAKPKGKPPRIFRYEITEVWGDMKGRLEVGAVILDKWKADRCWQLFDMKKGEPTGGWAAKLLGEADEKATAHMHEQWGYS